MLEDPVQRGMHAKPTSLGPGSVPTGESCKPMLALRSMTYASSLYDGSTSITILEHVPSQAFARLRFP